MNEYPLQYQFKALGPSSPEFVQLVRRLVESVLGPLEDAKISQRASSGGKYLSVSVDVILASEDQRRSVYHAFHAEKAIVWYV